MGRCSALRRDIRYAVDRAGRRPEPEFIPAGIVKQIHQALIAHGVRLVVDVGDSVDVSNTANLDARALYVQDLYNAGIAYYPVRGNHESNDGSSGEGVRPRLSADRVQSRSRRRAAWPCRHGRREQRDACGYPPEESPARSGQPDCAAGAHPAGSLKLGGNFSYPSAINEANGSASYSFDFENARFVLLDQFDRTGKTHNSSTAQQQPWISERLKDAKRPEHAFVFSHKNLLGGAHKDNLFGGAVTGFDPGDGAADTAAGAAKRQAEDAFIQSMAESHVHYFINGHDHHHAESIVAAPLNPAHTVHQIISQSDSSKFYTPSAPFSANETPVSEEARAVGYYIYTVDGPRVTMDYYSVDVTKQTGPNGADWRAAETSIHRTPLLTGNWKWRSASGYSLNGREFPVRQGGQYAVVQDAAARGSAGDEAYLGSAAKILAGVNGSARKTHDGRPLTKAINTGWAPGQPGLASDVLKLWGMQVLGADRTDDYVLSLSYAPARLADDQARTGRHGLLSRDSSRRWVGATSLNIGGQGAFHLRAYDPNADRLGRLGYQPGRPHRLGGHQPWRKRLCGR